MMKQCVKDASDLSRNSTKLIKVHLSNVIKNTNSKSLTLYLAYFLSNK
jgi:hypothetical protein